MSAEDPNIKALRAAGHDDAADLLEQVAADRERAETAKRGPGVLSIPAMSPGPVDALAQADANAARGMLEQINQLGHSTLTWPILNSTEGQS